MSPRAAQGIRLIRLSQAQREEHGCIVTFSNDEARWFTGAEALADAVAYADRRGLRIRTISTPETIYRDLQGSRAAQGGKRGGAVYFPEENMLGHARRSDLDERRSQ